MVDSIFEEGQKKGEGAGEKGTNYFQMWYLRLRKDSEFKTSKL